MSAKVTLTIKEGAGQGREFTFLSHDTFLLGRNTDCHVCIKDDDFISRHHFIMEACPPQASLRDLGSLNGTFVNKKCYGGRKKGETPEQGAKRAYPEVELKHGDLICVGNTTLEVGIYVLKDKGNPAVAPLPKDLQNINKLSPGQLAGLIFKPGKGADGKPCFTISGYRIEKEIGRGGCGAVYRAVREKDGERVALKVMLPRVAAEKNAIEQFLREIMAGQAPEHRALYAAAGWEAPARPREARLG